VVLEQRGRPSAAQDQRRLFDLESRRDLRPDPPLSADLRYYDTDARGFGDIYGARGAVALKAVF
jgi:hypothetical protein